MEARQAVFAVDAVFCISLHERADRRDMLLGQFQALGRPVEFVLVDRDAEDPERGCYHSHQHCARLALERGLRRILILEDDATFQPPDPVHLGHINRFLALRNPGVFYLGGILGRMWRIPWPGVVRCRVTGCHAYMLSARACRLVLGMPFAGEAIDSVFAERFKGYAAFPMLSEQQPEERVGSDLAAARSARLLGDAEVKDAAFWQRNRERQHESVRRNWGRTLLMRWL